jgi:hypothetical protein
MHTCSSNKSFQFITEILGSSYHSRLNACNVSKAECTSFFRWKAKYGYPAQVYPFERASIHGRVRNNRSNRVGSPFSPVHLRTQAVPASRLVFQVFYIKWRINTLYVGPSVRSLISANVEFVGFVRNSVYSYSQKGAEQKKFRKDRFCHSHPCFRSGNEFLFSLPYFFTDFRKVLPYLPKAEMKFFPYFYAFVGFE